MSRSSEIRTQRYKASRQRQQMLQEEQARLLQMHHEEEDEESVSSVYESYVNPENILPVREYNEQFDFHPLLASTIKSTTFYRIRCQKITTYNELVDEIYLKVTHLMPTEAFSTAVSTKPQASNAFCLLYRALEIKLTKKQMESMLVHKDSPFIRCVAALYLRYVGVPDQLYDWWKPLFSDNEKFSPEHDSKKTCTVAQWMRSILDVRYHGTILPRIPVPIERSIRAALDGQRSSGQTSDTTAESLLGRAPSETPHGQIPPANTVLSTGEIVRAQYWEDKLWYDARVEEPVEGKKNFYWVTYLPEEEYGNQEEVPLSEIRLLSTEVNIQATEQQQSVKRVRTDPPQTHVPPPGVVSYGDL